VVTELRTLVRELSAVRDASADEHRALEDIDVRGREGRQRFGFAVDATGLDASRAREEVRMVRADLEGASGATALALEALRLAQGNVLIWEGRAAATEPYAQLAQAYRACAEAVDRWAAACREEHRVRAKIELTERTARDLEYQLTELRAALANHEQNVDRDRAATQLRVVELSARAERIERRLLQLATEFCEPLRLRPELGELFGALESRG
jgi:serine/threonine-protein kinase